ncbi:MAG: hypothetical protein N2A42_09365 [Luteolibacter sp.]
MNDTHVKPQIMLSRAQSDTRSIAPFKREMDVIAKPRHPNTREVEGFRGWNPLRFWRRSDLIRERGGSGLMRLIWRSEQSIKKEQSKINPFKRFARPGGEKGGW